MSPLVPLAVAAAAVCIAIALLAGGRPPGPGRDRREAYLIAPYLDLNDPGERGSPYALAECLARVSPPA